MPPRSCSVWPAARAGSLRVRLRSGLRCGVNAALIVVLCAGLAVVALVPRHRAPRPSPLAGAGFSGTGVAAYGDAPSIANFAGIDLAAPAVAIAAAPGGEGYWVAAADGGVFAFGDAKFHGSMGGSPLYAPVVGMAATPDGRGYWLVAADGGVFAFGDARFHGSMGGRRLTAPVVGMAATPDGRGYWLVAADGGLFTFGDARFHGSTGGRRLGASATGMAATPDGNGYWLVSANGGVFPFGDAGYYGQAAGENIGTWVTGIAVGPNGHGYWLAAATAAVLNFGDAPSYGPSPNNPPFPPTAAIAATPDGKGYWLLQPDSIRTSFGTPETAANFPGGQGAVRVAAGQIGADPDSRQGAFCNPYGPCEEWCALFATWVWNRVGINIPHYAWVPDVYDWAAARGLAMSPLAKPAPGDLLIYGTGGQNLPHIAVVAEVWPDGAVTTIDGDSGPEPEGQFAVTFNGPFLPAYSPIYNGMPVYAFARAPL